MAADLISSSSTQQFILQGWIYCSEPKTAGKPPAAVCKKCSMGVRRDCSRLCDGSLMLRPLPQPTLSQSQPAVHSRPPQGLRKAVCTQGATCSSELKEEPNPKVSNQAGNLASKVDIKDPYIPIKELTKICLLADLTLMLAWNAQEAGKIIETYKVFEHKPPDLIMEKQEGSSLAKVLIGWLNRNEVSC